MLWTSLNHAFLVRSWNFSATNAPKKIWRNPLAKFNSIYPPQNQPIAPENDENGWVEDDSFFLGYFLGVASFQLRTSSFQGGGVPSLVVWHFLGGRFQPSQTAEPNRGPEDRGTVALDEFITTDGELQRPLWKLHSSWPGSPLGDWLIGWLFFVHR